MKEASVTDNSHQYQGGHNTIVVQQGDSYQLVRRLANPLAAIT